MKLNMNKYFILLVTILLIACTSGGRPEIRLRADGSIFMDGEITETKSLKKYSPHREIIIMTDIDVPYYVAKNLMIELEKMGFEKVGFITNSDQLKER